MRTLIALIVVAFGQTLPGCNSNASLAPPPTEEQKAAAKALDIPVDSTNSIGMQLKLIPGGTFMMGSPIVQKVPTQHKVTLSQPFMLGVHEVTQKQYEQVMGSNPSGFKNPQNPVEWVSWEDAMEFCRKLSALSEERAAGRVYRLPTEAQWEYACRAGTTTEYGFGDDASGLDKYAWYADNSGSPTHPEGQTHPVGQKRPNAWGLYDMHGNVQEWCADRHGDYPSGSVTDPIGAQSGTNRTIRGGSWRYDAVACRSAARNATSPHTRGSSMRASSFGFRVVCLPPGQ